MFLAPSTMLFMLTDRPASVSQCLSSELYFIVNCSIRLWHLGVEGGKNECVTAFSECYGTYGERKRYD